MEGYWCYWHGTKGYSGVGLHVQEGVLARAARVRPPRVRLREPDRDRRRPGRDLRVDLCARTAARTFPAKMRFLEALQQFTADLQAAGQPAVLCGDLNIARTDIDVHPKERKPRAIGQLPEERALLERIIAQRAGGYRPRAGARQRSDVHVVGAVAQHEGAQHRLAAGLRAGQRSRSSTRSRRASSSASSARATTGPSSRRFRVLCCRDCSGVRTQDRPAAGAGCSSGHA